LKHDEFIARVRDLAEVQTNEEAERAIRATLETLRERLAGNEPNNLADQLPPEIADPLRGRAAETASRSRSSIGASPIRKVSRNPRPSATPGRSRRL
jgi:uncharacterized protein (DUF2267 family)